MAETISEPLSDEAVVAFVAHFLDSNGLGVIDGLSVDTPLIELGLDSITATGLLIAAHQELVAATGRPGPAALTEIPPLEQVGDLARLLRGLAKTGT